MPEGKYLDVVVLLGAVLVKHSAGSGGGNKQDGPEGNLTLSREVDVGQRVFCVLRERERVRIH